MDADPVESICVALGACLVLWVRLQVHLIRRERRISTSGDD
jgi:hypothetical protein